MPVFTIQNISVKGIASAIPKGIYHNADLSLMSEREKQTFINTVGINTRRVAPANTCASDLCITAARELLVQCNLPVEEIGIVVFVTQTPDHLLPGNSMLVQHQLGLSTSTLLFDINQGCAGYVYGLSLISGIMQSTNIDNGLLMVGDTITRLLACDDRSTVPIFSDAGSATLLQKSTIAPPMHFHLGADGSGFNSIKVNGGAARNGFDTAANLTLEGVDVLGYTIKNVIPNIVTLKDTIGLADDDIDYYVFHQANRVINEMLLNKLKIDKSKAPETLSCYGNTSNATIPLTISSCLGRQLKHESKKLLLSGFGVGFSWGSAILDITNLVCPEIIEM